jgi:hypothetical protein
MQVSAVITDEVFALVGDVLGDFGQEIKGTEDLEITARSTSQVGTGRSREAAAVVLFGPIQHRPVVRQADHAGQADAISRGSRQTLLPKLKPEWSQQRRRVPRGRLVPRLTTPQGSSPKSKRSSCRNRNAPSLSNRAGGVFYLLIEGSRLHISLRPPPSASFIIASLTGEPRDETQILFVPHSWTAQRYRDV